MRIIRYILIVLSVFAVMGVKAQNNQDAWAGLNFYMMDNDTIKAEDKAVTVIFMGNSITQMWGGMRTFFKDNGYLNRGIGGQTSPQMLSRFRMDVVALHPQIVVINSGINDIATNTGTYSFDFTFGNIQSMTEIAVANGIKVILTSVLPAAIIPWRKEIRAVPVKIDQLNSAIKEYCTKHGYVYVDYYSLLVDDDGSKGLPKELTLDGVHVNGNGYAIMEKAVKKAIDKLLKK
ncbi:MAG: GDSL-type esterase/lipase family protein [Bacteroides sp.]|jgi:lysophospholipase L1-like esterase|nr:GDSL-type esterase/lipase family protein [Bacteroides sp.]